MRIMTYNILTDGRNLRPEATQPDRWSAIMAVIEAVGPDVVMLQEVMSSEFISRLADALGMAWYWVEDDGAHMRVGALASVSVASIETVHLGRKSRPALALSITAADGDLLTIYGVHTTAFYAWMFEVARRGQIKNLLAHAAQAHPRHLLIGDFNTFAPTDVADLSNAPRWVKMQTWPQLGQIVRWALPQVYAAGYVDCYRHFHPDEHGFTLPSANPEARLDYIFATPTLRPYLAGCDVVQIPDMVKTASDHRPVIVDLVF